MSGDAHVFAASTDISFQDVRNSEALGDLAQVALPARSISVDGSAVDNFEIRHFGKRRENVVLDAIGKKRILFVLAKVLEREHGDTFLRQRSRDAALRRDWSTN